MILISPPVQKEDKRKPAQQGGDAKRNKCYPYQFLSAGPSTPDENIACSMPPTTVPADQLTFNKTINHQSSHSSLPFAGGCAPPPAEPPPRDDKADVPIELDCDFRWSARLEKSSQKARLLSSMGTELYPPAVGPSTKRLKPSCAERAPDWAVFAAVAAAMRAWAAKSDSAIWKVGEKKGGN